LDNIDFDSGEIDDNVVQFDDDDLLKKAVKIRRTQPYAESSGFFTDTAKCDLLVEFHLTEGNRMLVKWKRRCCHRGLPQAVGYDPCETGN
jgi:hypothetical protein